MCPAVWPGVSSTSTRCDPKANVSPPPTVSSMPGTLAASLRGPTILHPVAAFSAALPPVWSAWWWVVRMWVSFQPFSLSAAVTLSASGASIEAVRPASGSWISTPKLSDRQGNW